MTARLAVSPGGLTLEPGGVELLDGPGADRLVRLVTGEERDSAVRIFLDQDRLDRLAIHARVRRGLGIVAPAVAPDVSVIDHLRAVTSREAARSLLDRAPLLRGRGSDRAGVLSGGERRVLAWLRVIALQPRAVVLDRAGTGLDPSALRWAHAAVRAWRQEGTAVVIRPGRPEERLWASHETA